MKALGTAETRSPLTVQPPPTPKPRELRDAPSLSNRPVRRDSRDHREAQREGNREVQREAQRGAQREVQPEAQREAQREAQWEAQRESQRESQRGAQRNVQREARVEPQGSSIFVPAGNERWRPSDRPDESESRRGSKVVLDAWLDERDSRKRGPPVAADARLEDAREIRARELREQNERAAAEYKRKLSLNTASTGTLMRSGPPTGPPTPRDVAPDPSGQAPAELSNDMREWLEITGWFDEGFRNKFLGRHRKILELDRQRAELEAEAQRDAEERARVARASSVLPSTSTPIRPATAMAPPPLPLGGAVTAPPSQPISPIIADPTTTMNSHEPTSIAPQMVGNKRPRSSEAADFRAPADKQPRRTSGDSGISPRMRGRAPPAAPSPPTLGRRDSNHRPFEQRISAPSPRGRSPPGPRLLPYRRRSASPGAYDSPGPQRFMSPLGQRFTSPPRGPRVKVDHDFYDAPGDPHSPPMYGPEWDRGRSVEHEERGHRPVVEKGNYRGRNFDPHYHDRINAQREEYARRGRSKGRGGYGYRGFVPYGRGQADP